MSKSFLLSILLLIPVLALCQDEAYSYSKIIKKLEGKAWLKTKFFESRHQHKNHDETYYFFKPSKNDDYKKDSLTFRYVTHHVTYSRAGRAHMETNVCNPIILFFNSPVGNEFLAPVVLFSWIGTINGEIIFKNDSEFMLTEYQPGKKKKNGSNRLDTITVQKYFRLSALPVFQNN